MDLDGTSRHELLTISRLVRSRAARVAEDLNETVNKDRDRPGENCNPHEPSRRLPLARLLQTQDERAESRRNHPEEPTGTAEPGAHQTRMADRTLVQRALPRRLVGESVAKGRSQASAQRSGRVSATCRRPRVTSGMTACRRSPPGNVASTNGLDRSSRRPETLSMRSTSSRTCPAVRIVVVSSASPRRATNTWWQVFTCLRDTDSRDLLPHQRRPYWRGLGR